MDSKAHALTNTRSNAKLEEAINNLQKSVKFTSRQKLWNIKNILSELMFKADANGCADPLRIKERNTQLQKSSASIRENHLKFQNRSWHKKVWGWITGSSAAEHAAIMQSQSEVRRDTGALLDLMSSQLTLKQGEINKLHVCALMQAVIDRELAETESILSKSTKGFKIAVRQMFEIFGISITPNAVELLERVNFFEIEQQTTEQVIVPAPQPKISAPHYSEVPHDYNNDGICKYCGGGERANSSWNPTCQKRAGLERLMSKQEKTRTTPHSYNRDGICVSCGGSRSANTAWNPYCTKKAA